MVACQAMDGPCDGHDWFLPDPPKPIWLCGGDGQRYLYANRPADGGLIVRYTFTGRSAPDVGFPSRILRVP